MTHFLGCNYLSEHNFSIGELAIEQYLGNHHMTIECSLPMLCGRSVDMTSDLGDNWSSECDIWYEMTVHDVHLKGPSQLCNCGQPGDSYMKPISPALDRIRAFCAEICEVCGKDGRSDYGSWRHFGSFVELMPEGSDLRKYSSG